LDSPSIRAGEDGLVLEATSVLLKKLKSNNKDDAKRASPR
jgi:hypothetical protein